VVPLEELEARAQTLHNATCDHPTSCDRRELAHAMGCGRWPVDLNDFRHRAHLLKDCATRQLRGLVSIQPRHPCGRPEVILPQHLCAATIWLVMTANPDVAAACWRLLRAARPCSSADSPFAAVFGAEPCRQNRSQPDAPAPGACGPELPGAWPPSNLLA